MQLPRRTLGRTGLEISVLGMGGFHQVEVSQEVISEVVAKYRAAGGNYVETARSYGGGASEVKIGRALGGDREGLILGSKTSARDEETAWRDINTSVENLGASPIDLYFFHGVGDTEDLDKITAPGGALKAYERAIDEGLIRHMAMSSHWPLTYIEGAKRLPIDIVLIWGNYLDFCNYPEIPGEVLPALREDKIGVIFMKPVGDGFLYRSPREAFRYALAQDADCLTAGFNSLEMLEADIAACCEEGVADYNEIAEILAFAPELGRYVCRQCEQCSLGELGPKVKRVFELEGKFDRQMDDRLPVDAAQYALRMRLKGWFHQEERARAMYADEGAEGLALEASNKLGRCRYGLDVPRKLRIAHAKLSREARVEEI